MYQKLANGLLDLAERIAKEEIMVVVKSQLNRGCERSIPKMRPLHPPEEIMVVVESQLNRGCERSIS
jgi:hypothetical protein